MIKELAHFTEALDEDLKNRGVQPREGLHVLLKLKYENGEWQLDSDKVMYERFTRKMTFTSEFLQECAFLSQNAWCIDTNKCFDLPTKAIHSCSPYCVAFKKEHLKGGEKYQKNKIKDKKQIYERFDDYFSKSLNLLESEEAQKKCQAFAASFSNESSDVYFEKILIQKERELKEKRDQVNQQVEALKEQINKSVTPAEKKLIKEQAGKLTRQLEPIRELSDSDYIIFYLDEPLEQYKVAHDRYLADKLFNTAAYNTEPNEEGIIYGTSNFLNGFNSSMPFLLHQTASFDITNRISDKEAKYLYQFQQLLPRKILPNPLPIFIFKEELQEKVIGLFKDSEYKIGYEEIVKQLWKRYQKDFGNYYLLYYQNTKDGLVFRDFDFVSRFDYELKDEPGQAWRVQDLFGATQEYTVSNVFELQNKVLPVMFNNNLIVKIKNGTWLYKYFDDIDEQYCKSARNYLIILKYRKAFYDFIYKSQRQAVTQYAFDDIMLTGILEDIRLDEFKDRRHSESFNIRRKLNIWFSLHEKFISNQTYETSMASKLKEYQKFITDLREGRADHEQATTAHFAFAAGQVMFYILKKSRSADQSYQRLERYLQQAHFAGVQEVVAGEFTRYKHENYSGRFNQVASFVLAYETSEPVKKYLPQMLAGVFANNLLFSDQDKSEETTNKEVTA